LTVFALAAWIFVEYILDMSKRELEEPLYVKLPASAATKLDRAGEVLGVHKKALVAGLVEKYIDRDGRAALGAIPNGPTMGTYSFQAYDPPAPEVMNVAQLAELLQLPSAKVLELAEAGKLPGRKLGTEWRFSRTAIVAWLAG
jgi:excisionase family DNA binding protein